MPEHRLETPWSAENLLAWSCATNRSRHGRATRPAVQVSHGMKHDRVQGQIGKVWSKYIYDCDCPEPRWQPHPHRRYKLVGRLLSAFAGSIVAVGVILLRLGVTTKIDEGSLLIGATFWVTAVVGGVLWIASVLAIADTQQKQMMYYFVAGMHPPAWGCTTLF